MRECHIAGETAVELVRSYPEAVQRQLAALPHRDRSNIRDLPSWLVRAIVGDYELPESLIKSRHKEAERKQARSQRAYEEARQSHESRFREAYSRYVASRLGEIKSRYHRAYRAFEEATAEEREKTVGLLGKDRSLRR